MSPDRNLLEADTVIQVKDCGDSEQCGEQKDFHLTSILLCVLSSCLSLYSSPFLFVSLSFPLQAPKFCAPGYKEISPKFVLFWIRL